MVGRPVQFPEQIVVRVTEEVRETLDRMAADRKMRIGEVTRMVIDIGLETLTPPDS